MMNISKFSAAVVAFGLVTLAAQAQTGDPPTKPFPKPTGPYAVGIHEYLWIDQKRDETFTKDPNDRRHMLVRIWYPAQAEAGAVPAPYILHADEFPENNPLRKLQKVQTNALTDAPFPKGKERFPLLLYNPGGGNARFTASFEAEQLASHGYIVAAVDHAGFGPTVLYPDGYHFKADARLAPDQKNGDMKESALAFWKWLGDDVFPTWTADASYALDKLAELDGVSGQLFFHKIDLTRIGAMGWSFGGATSIQLSRQDPRIKAVIDHDGQLFGDVAEKGTSRPFMLMHHGAPDEAPAGGNADAMKELVDKVRAIDTSLKSHATNDWYDITIAKTRHGHFSDWTLFTPPPPDLLEARRTHQIIVAYTLAFFDKYLRGHDSDLLAGASSGYPEVTFSRK